MWRLWRRIFGYARKYYFVLLLMFPVMALLAGVDRGRAYLIKPVFDQLGSEAGLPVTCDKCALVVQPQQDTHSLLDCPGCGD
ncbi:MAG: hypothetical protein ACYTAF_07070, partial [Planctomycetota bacterium]